MGSADARGRALRAVIPARPPARLPRYVWFSVYQFMETASKAKINIKKSHYYILLCGCDLRAISRFFFKFKFTEPRGTTNSRCGGGNSSASVQPNLLYHLLTSLLYRMIPSTSPINKMKMELKANQAGFSGVFGHPGDLSACPIRGGTSSRNQTPVQSPLT